MPASTRSACTATAPVLWTSCEPFGWPCSTPAPRCGIHEPATVWGDRAVLIDCAWLDEAQGWFAAMHEQVDAVLGARTVLLRGEPSALRALVHRSEPRDLTSTRTPTRSPSRWCTTAPTWPRSPAMSECPRTRSSPPTPAHPDPWRSGVSRPDSRTLPRATIGSPCRAGTHPARTSQRARSDWPEGSAASTHGRRPAAGS